MWGLWELRSDVAGRPLEEPMGARTTLLRFRGRWCVSGGADVDTGDETIPICGLIPDRHNACRARRGQGSRELTRVAVRSTARVPMTMRLRRDR